MAAFGQNVYILDATLGNVFRYVSRDGIFTEVPSRFLEKDNRDLLGQAKDFYEQLDKCVIKAQRPGLVVYGGSREDVFYYGGEERIREHLGQLYGAVNGYEGHPAEYQAARSDSLAHELEDVIADFHKMTEKELATVNAGLKKKKNEAISVLAETDWQKKREAEGGSGAGTGLHFMHGQVQMMNPDLD